jgi:hypothetical protein
MMTNPLTSDSRIWLVSVGLQGRDLDLSALVVADSSADAGRLAIEASQLREALPIKGAAIKILARYPIVPINRSS